MLASSSLSRLRTDPVLVFLTPERSNDDSGKEQPGGLLKALDAAAYVMTVSILLRARR